MLSGWNEPLTDFPLLESSFVINLQLGWILGSTRLTKSDLLRLSAATYLGVRWWASWTSVNFPSQSWNPLGYLELGGNTWSDICFLSQTSSLGLNRGISSVNASSYFVKLSCYKQCSNSSFNCVSILLARETCPLVEAGELNVEEEAEAVYFLLKRL